MANWEDILNEIAAERSRAQQAFDSVRKRHLLALANHTGRVTIAYYSGWLAKSNVLGTEIRDEDRDGFMRALHGVDTSTGLDLLLHTPGGSIAATQAIVLYLREKFGADIRAIIPHTAMSAGTIIACSTKAILMTRHSSIGPIDPQIGGIPAQGVLREFERAYQEISADPSRAAVWHPILAQYPPTFVGNCENAVKWSEKFTREQLADNMFNSARNKNTKIDKFINALTDYDEVKLHERQINYQEARKIGLNIDLLEDDQALQDLVLTAHHCYAHTLSSTAAFKIIENHQGASFIKLAM